MFVIAGASGNTGSVVARTLLAHKQPVRVIVRGAAQADKWRAQGAEVAQVSLEDADALAGALHGATGVYLMLPPDMRATDPLGRCQRLTDGLFHAVHKSGVGRVVLLSSIGAHHPQGTGIVLSLHHLERKFSALQVPVTAVRAGYFMENWGGVLPLAVHQGILPSFLAPADRAIPMVGTQDIGVTAAKALLHGGTGHHVIELGGPRDYSPADAAAAVSQILNKHVQLVLVPQEGWVPALVQAGLSQESAEQMAALNQAINSGHADWEQSPHVQRVRGEVPLETVFAGMLSGGGGGH